LSRRYDAKAMKREILADGEVILRADDLTFSFRRLRRADALRVTVAGFDRGQLGTAPLDEIAAAARLPRLELFVDARGVTGVTTAVREEWTAWFQRHQTQLSRVHILVSDRFMTSVMHVAQHLARVGSLIQIHSDPKSFEAAM
jgi:hypothetical protein